MFLKFYFLVERYVMCNSELEVTGSIPTLLAVQSLSNIALSVEPMNTDS